jgi:hypothetical protein
MNYCIYNNLMEIKTKITCKYKLNEISLQKIFFLWLLSLLCLNKANLLKVV